MISRHLKSAFVGVFALALCAASANAGSVTYNFIEDSGGPDPGTIGAFFVFASPPASGTSHWFTANPADVLDFEITDPKIGPGGSYRISPSLGEGITSSTGTSLDLGTYAGFNASNVVALVNLSTFPTPDEVIGIRLTATGNFVLATVPEPSSLLLAGTAALVGLGFWARRRTR